MQTSGSGAEIDVSLFPVLGAAIPQARAAKHACLSIEGGHAAFASRDGLATTHFHAQFGFAALAVFGMKEHHVVRVTRRGLDTASHKERILMRDQQFAIERNLRPAAAVHDAVVE